MQHQFDDDTSEKLVMVGGILQTEKYSLNKNNPQTDSVNNCSCSSDGKWRKELILLQTGIKNRAKMIKKKLLSDNSLLCPLHYKSISLSPCHPLAL